MKTLFCSTLFSILLLTVAAPASARVFNQEELTQVSRATGYILSARRGIEKINSYCGNTYSHLRSIARKATVGWNDRNGIIVKHANRLINLVIKDIELASGKPKANEIRGKMFGFLEKTTDSLVTELRKMPGAKRKTTCGSWVKSVGEGSWDIKRKNPTAYGVINRYKNR